MNESTIKEIEELNKSIDLMIESILHSEDDSSIPVLYLRSLEQANICSLLYIDYLNSICQVCDRTNQVLQLVRTIDEQTGEYNYQYTCSTCIKMFNLQVVDDESTEDINSTYVCDKCGRSVKSSDDLYYNRHEQRVCLNCLPE